MFPLPAADIGTAAADVVSSVLQSLLTSRGIASHYENLGYSPRDPEPRRWLSFEIGGQEYLFHDGHLLERGRDRWDRLERYLSEDDDALIADKNGTKEMLARHGFSTPRGKVFRRKNIQDARAAFGKLPKPLCVKPNNGSHGDCTFPRITERRWYNAALYRVAARYCRILVEQSVEGAVHRFFYVRPHVVAVKVLCPPRATGDGKSTVADLLKALNAERRERNLPLHTELDINDDDMCCALALQGYAPENIPEKGEVVRFSRVSNGSAGTVSINCLDKVHPGYLDLMAQACDLFPSLQFAGIDVILRDRREAPSDDNHWILEVNASPCAATYYYPWGGEKIDVLSPLVDRLIELAT
ncbi:hypothetical protein [Breoghania sp.]|uniref:hypothetical protein n=1 Tax=Breoghania sp. TaxID=2065378 RepID=UPI0026229BFD|nr:hypothetical protein [Breoghania sp.]MDJ0930290.1 hypothetical protein [Breoghania sp.]